MRALSFDDDIRDPESRTLPHISMPERAPRRVEYNPLRREVIESQRIALRRLREKVGLMQDNVAELTGLHPRLIPKLEDGSMPFLLGELSLIVAVLGLIPLRPIEEERHRRYYKRHLTPFPWSYRGLRWHGGPRASARDCRED